MSNDTDDRQIDELRKQVAELTARVWRLEQASQQAADVSSVPPPTQTSVHAAAPPPVVQQTPITIPTFASVEPPRPKQHPEQHTDGSLESRIGSQIFNRVGI